MKKSVFVLFIILLVSLLAVHASAATQSHPHSGSHCVCGNSAIAVGDHQCENITWSALPTSIKDFSSLKSGNYYLTRNVTVTASTVTILEQTSYYCRNETSYYSEELGEDVYIICMVDKEMTFQKLYDTGYLPITCQELIAPVPSAPAAVTDSETEHTLDTLFSGTFTANHYICSVTVTITDADGNTVQSLTGFGNRGGAWRTFKLSRLLTDAPERVVGSLDPAALASGTYTCSYTCRFSSGQTIIARQFDFTA